jgi:hypothetical protein
MSYPARLGFGSDCRLPRRTNSDQQQLLLLEFACTPVIAVRNAATGLQRLPARQLFSW